MEPVEIVEVEDTTVVCNGGGGALGHPRVFLAMGDEGHIDCPYCGCRFKLTNPAAAETPDEEVEAETKSKWSITRLFRRG